MSSCLIPNVIDQAKSSHFFLHRDRIEQEIAKTISSFGEKNKLRDACEYALTSGGKRFRPMIVLMTAEGLGHGLNVYHAALSVEFFHTASLIADDLPCMDNDDERREKPSLHKVYGETIALLASYALITSAFEKIHKNALVLQNSGTHFACMSDKVCTLSLEIAAYCSGILGATGGQFLDLFPPTISLETVRQVIYKKTVTLFETAFAFGWLFGGGDILELDLVKKCAFHMGMAFQIADDIADLQQDEKKQREISMARLVGKERALVLFEEEEMRHFQRCLNQLGLSTPSFEKMSHMMIKLAHTR